jgi:hypothetical protein
MDIQLHKLIIRVNEISNLLFLDKKERDCPTTALCFSLNFDFTTHKPEFVYLFYFDIISNFVLLTYN